MHNLLVRIALAAALTLGAAGSALAVTEKATGSTAVSTATEATPHSNTDSGVYRACVQFDAASSNPGLTSWLRVYTKVKSTGTLQLTYEMVADGEEYVGSQSSENILCSPWTYSPHQFSFRIEHNDAGSITYDWVVQSINTSLAENSTGTTSVTGAGPDWFFTAKTSANTYILAMDLSDMADDDTFTVICTGEIHSGTGDDADVTYFGTFSHDLDNAAGKPAIQNFYTPPDSQLYHFRCGGIAVRGTVSVEWSLLTLE